jgi:hypothetical protein
VWEGAWECGSGVWERPSECVLSIVAGSTPKGLLERALDFREHTPKGTTWTLPLGARFRIGSDTWEDALGKPNPT